MVLTPLCLSPPVDHGPIPPMPRAEHTSTLVELKWAVNTESSAKFSSQISVFPHTFVCSLISLKRYLLNTYYVPGTVLEEWPVGKEENLQECGILETKWRKDFRLSWWSTVSNTANQSSKIGSEMTVNSIMWVSSVSSALLLKWLEQKIQLGLFQKSTGALEKDWRKMTKFCCEGK